MVCLITPANYAMHRDDLNAMYRLRCKVFFEQPNWQMKIQDDLEKDEYDEKHAVYLIFKDKNQRIRGCQRYINMAHPCMFDCSFDFILPKLKRYKNANHLEASRLAIDCNYNENYTREDARDVYLRIAAASMLFGIESHIKSFLTVSYFAATKLLAKLFSTSILARSTINNEKMRVTEYFADHKIYAKLIAKINLPYDEPVYVFAQPNSHGSSNIFIEKFSR